MTGACITIPGIVDLMDIMKNKLHVDENSANDMASGMYNLAVNLGEAIGPILGGYFTNKNGFESACYSISTINLVFARCFFFYNWPYLKEEYKKINQPLLYATEGDEYEVSRHVRRRSNVSYA